MLGVVVYVAVHGYFIHTKGQTIGKMALGIKMVRKDGSRATFGRLVGLRFAVLQIIYSIPLLGGLFALVDVLMIFRESRYCLHDDLADTVVVKA